MSVVQVRWRSVHDVEATFDRLTRWEEHSVPFTTIRRTPEGFTARTAWGPIGFDDPMEVVAFERPRFVRIEKRGRVVTGWAEIEVHPSGTGSEVRWTEYLRVRGVPGVLTPVVDRASERMLSGILRGLLA